ncbi:TetR family transcriptional regulator [Streptomyces sp. NPDC048179]
MGLSGLVISERGHEATSIAAASAKCGLPASSIYWHFKDEGFDA